LKYLGGEICTHYPQSSLTDVTDITDRDKHCGNHVVTKSEKLHILFL